ncbi:hypothetical protein BDD12DRAFT_809194 [Trichophaea hybrida]|nr:hypothetical protein BDD12DRAFT_809194 [Trichophaea hybrida]
MAALNYLVSMLLYSCSGWKAMAHIKVRSGEVIMMFRHQGLVLKMNFDVNLKYTDRSQTVRILITILTSFWDNFQGTSAGIFADHDDLGSYFDNYLHESIPVLTHQLLRNEIAEHKTKLEIYPMEELRIVCGYALVREGGVENMVPVSNYSMQMVKEQRGWRKRWPFED